MTIDLEKAKILREQGLAEIRPYVKFITNTTILSFTIKALEMAPLYFWIIPASSSGKYHPEWSLGDGGTVRHTVFAMYLGHELSRTFGLTELEHDIVISALALHDTLKYGIEYDVRYFPMHPYLPRNYYGNKHDGIVTSFFKEPGIPNTLFDAIERHMGSIATGEWHSVGRVKPENKVEYVVHLADYLASRKQLKFADFE